jgi:hypothetical protein
MSNKNKFQNFFEARKTPEAPEQGAEVVTAAGATVEEPTTISRNQEAETPRRVGRPAGGKKSNPDYQQVTSYIRRQTYQDTQVKLLRQGRRQDFSDLVEELLSKWLQEA